MSPARPQPSSRPAMARRLIVLAVALLVGVVALTVAFPSDARAQEESADQAAWPQFQRDPGHTGFVASGPQPGYREAWRSDVEVARDGLSAPVTDGEVLYALSHTEVHAFRVDDGEEVWSLPREGGTLGMPALAAREDGAALLLYTEGMGEQTTLVARDADELTEDQSGRRQNDRGDADADDSPAFEVDIGASSRSGITVDGSMAFVADDTGGVYAIDLRRGELAWKVRPTSLAILAPVAARSGVLYLSVADERGRGSVIAISQDDGSRQWTTAIDGIAAFASAVTLGDEHLFIAFSDRTIRAFSIEDGAQVWSKLLLQTARTSPVSWLTAPAYADGVVFVPGSAGALFALSDSTGELLWTYQFLDQRIFHTSPVIVGDSVLVGVLDASDPVAGLAAVDRTTGRQLWQGPLEPGPLKGLAVTADHILAGRGGPSGGVVAFASDPTSPTTDLASPTTLDLTTNLTQFALAAGGTAVVVFGATRAFGALAAARRRRRGEDGEPFEELDGIEAASGEPGEGDVDDDDDGGTGDEPSPSSGGWR